MSIMNHDFELSRIARTIRSAFNHRTVSEIKDLQVMVDPRTFDYLVSVQRRFDGARAVLTIPVIQAEQWTFSLSEVDKAMLVLFLQ